MKINNSPGELTDIPAKKEPLLTRRRSRDCAGQAEPTPIWRARSPPISASTHAWRPWLSGRGIKFDCCQRKMPALLITSAITATWCRALSWIGHYVHRTYSTGTWSHRKASKERCVSGNEYQVSFRLGHPVHYLFVLYKHSGKVSYTDREDCVKNP